MDFKTLALFFDTCGPWGVCAVLVFGIAYLYRSTNKVLEARNNQLVETMQETTAALQQTANALQQNAEQRQRVHDVLIRVEHILNNPRQ